MNSGAAAVESVKHITDLSSLICIVWTENVLIQLGNHGIARRAI